MINITLEQAKEILDRRSNGGLSGISSDRGGVAWLDDEWRLCELEALCVLIRHEAGSKAEGAEELVKYQKQQDEDYQKYRSGLIKNE